VELLAERAQRLVEQGPATRKASRKGTRRRPAKEAAAATEATL
jgi:hypothetical protein